MPNFASKPRRAFKSHSYFSPFHSAGLTFLNILGFPHSDMSGCNHSHLRDNSTSSASFLEIDFSSCPNVVFFTSSEKSSKVFLEIAPFLKTRSLTADNSLLSEKESIKAKSEKIPKSGANAPSIAAQKESIVPSLSLPRFFTSLSSKDTKSFLEYLFSSPGTSFESFFASCSDSAAAAVRFKISLKNSPADLRVNVRATIDAGSASSRAIAIYRPVRL